MSDIPENEMRRHLLEDRERYIDDPKRFDEAQERLAIGDFLLRTSTKKEGFFVLTNKSGKKFFLEPKTGGFRLTNPENPKETLLYSNYDLLIENMRETSGEPFSSKQEKKKKAHDSEILARKPARNVILDFDNTLVNGHFHNGLMELTISPEDFAKWDREKQMTHMDKVMKRPWAKNPDELKSTLIMLIDNGFQLGIASFTSYPDAIKIFLEELLGQDSLYLKHFRFGHNIVTGLPSDEDMVKFGKNPYIQNILKNIHAKPQETVFADDDPANRKLAAELLTPENVIHVSELPIHEYDPLKKGSEAEGYHFLRDIRAACGLDTELPKPGAKKSKP